MGDYLATVKYNSDITIEQNGNCVEVSIVQKNVVKYKVTCDKLYYIYDEEGNQYKNYI